MEAKGKLQRLFDLVTSKTTRLRLLQDSFVLIVIKTKISFLNQEKQFNLDTLRQNQKPQKVRSDENVYLQEGDIVFMKLYDQENKKEYIIRGNGNVVDNIQLQSFEPFEREKRIQKNISECLFQVQKTVMGQNNFRPGNLVCLKQKIQLMHVNSQKYLNLDLEDINLNQGSFKLTLNNTHSNNKRFMISSQDKKTYFNDFVLYSDKYYLNSFDNSELTISLEQEQDRKNKNTRTTSFLHNQLYMSKSAYLIDFNCYQSLEEHQKRAELQESSLYENQLVYIINPHVKGLLTSRARDLKERFVDRKVFLERDHQSQVVTTANQETFAIKYY